MRSLHLYECHQDRMNIRMSQAAPKNTSGPLLTLISLGCTGPGCWGFPQALNVSRTVEASSRPQGWAGSAQGLKLEKISHSKGLQTSERAVPLPLAP